MADTVVVNMRIKYVLKIIRVTPKGKTIVYYLLVADNDMAKELETGSTVFRW